VAAGLGLALEVPGAGAVVPPVACDADPVAACGALVLDELQPLARTSAPAATRTAPAAAARRPVLVSTGGLPGIRAPSVLSVLMRPPNLRVNLRTVTQLRQ
jgi:hypothetical protein